jgi:hypothetical protein
LQSLAQETVKQLLPRKHVLLAAHLQALMQLKIRPSNI